MKKGKIILAVIFALLLLMSLKQTFQNHYVLNEDYDVYYTAANMISRHDSRDIYSGAPKGDPQVQFADKSSQFAQTARVEGLHRIMLYVYPPLLADILIPFAHFSVIRSATLWRKCNTLALFLICIILVNALELELLSFGAAFILSCIFCFRPIMDCLELGQITIVLLLLWVAGAGLYLSGWKKTSAWVFALATVIKLTPLIVVAPMILWREWKFLRAYVVALIVFVGFMCAVNGPHLVGFYFAHVMPSMSAGVPDIANQSLPSAIERLVYGATGKFVGPAYSIIPPYIIAIGRFVTIIMGAISLALVYMLGENLSQSQKLLVISLFALLSVTLAPVFWGSAYVQAYFALVCLWKVALTEGVDAIEMSLLALGTLIMGTLSLVEIATSFYEAHLHYGISLIMSAVMPFVGVALALYSLHKIKATRRIGILNFSYNENS